MSARDDVDALEAVIRQLSYCKTELEKWKLVPATVLVDAAISAICEHLDRFGDGGRPREGSDQWKPRRKI